MNILQRTLLEKTGHENGFENILPNTIDSVLLGSARHRAQVAITQDSDYWLLEVTSTASKLLSPELVRSFKRVAIFE